MRDVELMVIDIRAGNPYPAGALSNFVKRQFTFDSIDCQSMEGFLQSLKFPDSTKQRYICSLYGVQAKEAGKEIDWQTTQTLYWNNREYQRNSNEYFSLLKRCYFTMFEQNPSAQQALIDTGNAKLTHSIGCNDPTKTIVTPKEFCSILTDIRGHLQASTFLEF